MNISLDENSGIVGDAPSLKADQDEGENVPKSFCPLSFTLHHITCFNLSSKVLTHNFKSHNFGVVVPIEMEDSMI